MLKKILIGCAVLAVAIAVYLWTAFNPAPSQRPDFTPSRFTIDLASGKTLDFIAEVAVTEQEQAYGLMFIKSLATHAGMIFPYNPPHEVAFWMKDTFIPLDMLFVGPDRRIGRIVSNAVPHDLTPISSEIPVIAVIEINGGQAEKEGIAVGDKIDFGPNALLPGTP